MTNTFVFGNFGNNNCCGGVNNAFGKNYINLLKAQIKQEFALFKKQTLGNDPLSYKANYQTSVKLTNNNYSLDTISTVKKGNNIPVNNQINPDEIWNSIDPEERKLVEGKNLNELDKYTGKPVYVIAKGSKDGRYHIYKNGHSVKNLDYGNNFLYNYKDKIQKVGGGQGFGSDIMQLIMGGYSYCDECGEETLWGGFLNILNPNGQQKPGFYVAEGETLSPLVVDYNQDGKVSAQAGMGIDIDGDGKADGAATNGDKMLAMSDINGNGSIDGSEVFGNKTVNPFTGQALNAKNGFEALKQIAISAQQCTGINCFDGQNVDLNKLKAALATKGVNLGFVSGNNNTQLEALSKISKINVVNYMNTKQSGRVQHNQQGTGTAGNGSTMLVDDVWFA